MVPQSKPDHAAVKAYHKTECDRLVGAPPGFLLEGDDEFQYAFHAGVNNGQLLAMGNPLWPPYFADLVTYFPPGQCRRITLNLVAFVIMGLKQVLTFVQNAAGQDTYGE